MLTPWQISKMPANLITTNKKEKLVQRYVNILTERSSSQNVTLTKSRNNALTKKSM